MTKVYVSATFKDLEECRAAVQLALRRLRVEDMAMESYVAEGRRPLDKCLADVTECDLYIGIFAWRYGFVPEGLDKSITELEYREAVSRGKPCLVFLLDEHAPWPRSQIDRGLDADRIETLRADLGRQHVCSTFTGPEDLAALVTAAVANWMSDNESPSQGMHSLSADTLKRYFGRLRQQYGGLDLDSLTPPQREEYLQIRLASVFVEQYVREDPPPVELPREWLERLRDRHHVGADEWPEGVDPAELATLRESYRAKPLQRLFDVTASPEQTRFVLLGDPGSGKSTVARYLALALAGAHTDDRIAPLADHLPLLIELRSYIALSAEGKCQNFLDYLDHHAGSDGLGLERQALQHYLSLGGRAVVIFDGLDEVFDRHREDRRRREEIANQIAGFAADYPQVRVIVTSRIIGYSRHILTEAEFTHFTLQDLDEDQIGEFLNSWYRLAVHERPDDADAARARLLEAMRHSSAIRELAGNPLLLTILAIIGKHQALPRDRWKLYDHAATVLVEHWDVNRHLREQQSRPDFIDAEDKKELLRRLAYWMQSGERALSVNYVDSGSLSQVFEEYLIERYRSEPVVARTTAQAMINQFRERNFILSRYGLHLYGFVHRTFLEFFCADAIVGKFKHDQEWSLERLKDQFRRHWAEPSWREVLRLVASALHERHTAELIELLTNEVNTVWPAGEFPEPPWNLALAVQCLAEVRKVHSAVAEPAESLLRKLILLLEHGVTINDVDTANLIEDEILPAARIIGANWPGRDAYLSWYRRRGVRVISGLMAPTARLAAMLSTPAEHIEDLFDEVLGTIPDSRASFAAVAGLAELAGMGAPTGADPAASGLTRARARALLVRRARDDRYAGVRLAAVQALGELYDADTEVWDLLIERVRADGSAGVRLAAVQSLGERYRADPSTRALLIDRVGTDSDAAVRRAATQTLGTRYTPDDELLAVLEERLCDDRDAEVITMAAHALAERFGADRQVRALLIDRVRGDNDGAVRRAAIRVLGERFGADPQVAALLIEAVEADADPGVLRVAARALLSRSTTGDQPAVRGLLGDRVRSDSDESVRCTAVQVLTELFDNNAQVRAIATACARRDQDAGVRLAAVQALGPWADADDRVRRVLAELTRKDADSAVRLAAVDALVNRVGVDQEIRTVFGAVARHDIDSKVRVAVIKVLAGMYGAEPRISSLLSNRCVEDEHPEVRLEAARALVEHVNADASARNTLISRVEYDHSGRVFACAAAAVINRIEPVRARELLIARSANDSNAHVRLAAVRLLAHRAGSADVRRALAIRVSDDPDADVFGEAAIALARHPKLDDPPRDALITRAHSEDPAIRRTAVRVLGEFFGADADVRELLVQVTRTDRDIQVRREVLGTLCEWLADYPEVHALFVECLGDRDWSVREAAVRVLGERFGSDPQTRALLVDRARDDRDPEFRRLAGQALTWPPDADPDDLPDILPKSDP